MSPVDKNTINKVSNSENKIDSYKIPCNPFSLYSLKYEKEVGFVRFNTNSIKDFPDNLKFLNKETAGGRLRFLTDVS